MANQLNGSGITLDSIAPSDIETGGTGKVLLYASGSGANSRLYVKSGADTQALLGTDLDSLTAVDAVLAASDLLLFSDQSDSGIEKAVTMANVSASVFAGINGDASIASTGVLTIAADAVHGTMLNTDAADGSTMELSSDSLSVLKVPNALTVDDATIQLSSGTTYDGAAARTIAIKNGGVDADALASSVAGTGIDGGGGSALSVSAAQTAISSLKHDSLVVGRSSGNDDITFSDDTIDLMTNNASRLKVQTTNTTISNNLVVEGNLTVEGSAVEVQQGFVVTASIQFEGSTPDGNELTLTTANPTADRTVTIPDLDGHVPLLAGAISNSNVTAAEFALLDGGSTVGTTALASGDGFLHNDNGTMKHTSIDKIADFFAGNGLAASSGVLAVGVDDSSIELDSDAVRVKALGIATTMLAADAVTGAKIADNAVDSEHIALGALDQEHYATGSVENSHLAGGIANAKLSNSSITVTDGSSTTAIALGNAITFSGTSNEVEVGESSGTITVGLPASVQITTGLTVPSCGVTTALAVGGGYGSTGLTVDASGNLTMDGNLTVGVNGTASDVAFYGADSGDGLFWDGDNSRLGLDKSAQAGYAIDVKQGAGDVRADSFVTYSDRELKHNIVAIDDSLDKIMKLDAVSYDMKNSGRHEIGFIAQEVAKVVPEICALDNNGVGRGIDYGRLTSLLAGAVKTQQNQIAELKAAIAKLDK